MGKVGKMYPPFHPLRRRPRRPRWVEWSLVTVELGHGGDEAVDVGASVEVTPEQRREDNEAARRERAVTRDGTRPQM